MTSKTKTALRRIDRRIRAAAAVTIVVAGAVGGLAAHELRASGGGTAPAAATLPAWFAPIAESYGNDPRLTPEFDFASLYRSYPPWFDGIAESYGWDPRVTPEFDFASLYSLPKRAR